MKGGEIKILKEGDRITYILARENENIPLLAVENGVIRLKARIESSEVAFALIAALRHAVMKHMKRKDVYRRCPIERFYWQFVKEGEFIEAVEALRQDE